MPKYIPNKTAEIEEIQNQEIKRLTKALEEILHESLEHYYSTSHVRHVANIKKLAREALNPGVKTS